MSDGRVERLSAKGLLKARTMVLESGESAGWEVGMLDHFRAVANALGNKLRAVSDGARAPDTLGGNTYSFDVYPGHPHEARVLGLLRHFRQEIDGLWGDVSDFNKGRELPADSRKVTFYFGQNTQEPDDLIDNN